MYIKIFILATLALPAWGQMRVKPHYLRKAPGVYDEVPSMSFEAYKRALDVVQCENAETLNNGASLSVKLTSPTDGATYLDSVDIPIEGTATIGEGEPSTHWTYVIDVSGSTSDPCGNNGDSIIDCEKEAVLDVHTEIANSGSAVDYGLATYSLSAASVEFSGSLVTTDATAMAAAIGNIPGPGGRTNFAAGLQAAQNSVTASTAPGNKYVIFLSDGRSNEGAGDFDAAVNDLAAAGVTIFSFAVGSGASCTTGSAGTLQQMADATGGKCVNVIDAADLDDALLNLIATEMKTDTVTIDGAVPGSLSRTNSPPFDGPGTDTLTATAGAPQSVGNHIVCISATGLGPKSDPLSEETVECCVEYRVVSFDLTPETVTNELSLSQTHTVTAKVSAGEGDGVVEGYLVDFAVTGQNELTAYDKSCMPVTCETNDDGEVTFTYKVPLAPESLGTDDIDAHVRIGDGEETVQVEKHWVDTTPPVASCVEGPNPSGNIPEAPGNGGQGQNQDGFYTLLATDDVYPPTSLNVYVEDNGSGWEYGPYAPGTNIKWIEKNGAKKPSEKSGPGVLDWQLTGKGDALVYAIDGSGNEGEKVECLVPPPPK